MYFPKPSLNENDMAIIERGDTAAHSIEAGQYVSWHGKTGKAKAAILQGATLDDTLFDYSENGAINELNASITANENWTLIKSGGAESTSVDIPATYNFIAVGIYDSAGNMYGITANIMPISVMKNNNIGLASSWGNKYILCEFTSGNTLSVFATREYRIYAF